MDNTNNRQAELLRLYFEGKANSEQTNELFDLLTVHPQPKIIIDALNEAYISAKTSSESIDPVISDRIHAQIMQSIIPFQRSHRIHFLKTTWFKYAAAITIIFGMAAYLWSIQKDRLSLVQTVQSVPVNNDVLPGSDKAILTLSNGEKLELKPTIHQIITDGKLAINNKNGKLIYSKTDIVVYNTMATPKGGQYQLTLPDGSNVWLNAASSITFPTSFSGQKREVNITGEAYFEVAKNPKQPFIVKTYKDEITVLGTHFNVNAYADEIVVKTSLLEGSVKINNQILKPGEAYFDGKIVTTNIQQDVAWKNGVFDFDMNTLREAMRKLSRWYDVEIVYPESLAEKRFGGKMGRDLTLSQVLKLLDGLEMRFRLEGRTILVTR